MTTRINRREFLAGVGMVAAAGQSVVTQNRQTRLVLLGTGGGPRPRTANSASAQVIVSNGAAYVIDCGDGVARQMAFARVPLASLRHVFITHQHSDLTEGTLPVQRLAVLERRAHIGRVEGQPIEPRVPVGQRQARVLVVSNPCPKCVYKFRTVVVTASLRTPRRN